MNIFLQDFDSKLSTELMFLDWFLQQQLQTSTSALSCPDILYIVDESSKPEMTREDWKGWNILHDIEKICLCLDNPFQTKNCSVFYMVALFVQKEVLASFKGLLFINYLEQCFPNFFKSRTINDAIFSCGP